MVQRWCFRVGAATFRTKCANAPMCPYVPMCETRHMSAGTFFRGVYFGGGPVVAGWCVLVGSVGGGGMLAGGHVVVVMMVVAGASIEC